MASRKPSTTFYQPNAASLSPDNNIGYLIKNAYASIVRVADIGVMPLGLTAVQWRPLVILRHGGVNTPAELARQVNIDTGAMTRTLDRLEAKGFLTRHRCLDDRRVVRLELTTSGHQVVDDILPVIARSLNAHLDGFSKDEILQFLDFLQRLIANGAHQKPSPSADP